MPAGAVPVHDVVVQQGEVGVVVGLDARTGRILFDYQGEGTSNAGPAIVDGTVYWGNGYLNIPGGIGGSTTFYAFSVGGR